LERVVAKITISYRREDSGIIVGRIFDRLVAHYGTDTVFRDIDNIPPGTDYREFINDALRSTDILLAVVGLDWVGKTPDGRTRIAEPTDLVRIEVEVALQKRIRIVPVLVAKATMPNPNELPEVLQDFAYRHAIRVDAFEDFDDHLRRLMRSLDRLLQSAGERPPRIEVQKGAEQDKAVGDITALGAKQDGPQEAARAGRKEAEEYEATPKTENEERRERTSAQSSLQAQQSTMPELRERLEHVPSEQSKAAATSVPWRIIAGSVTILGVLGVIGVAVLPPRSPVAPQPAPAVTAPPTPAATPQPALPVTPQDANAMFNLGKRYESGDGVAKDYDKAREWYEKAAAKGDPAAMTRLGVLYHNGLGVAQDYATAREWYDKAAAEDNSDAMYNLGLLYNYGRGVAQDYGKAREWFEKAAAKGNSDAMTNLGVLYDDGRGVTQDYGKAREWFEKAAAKDNARAMARLGVLYKYGWGVGQDSGKAREWFEKAAAKGDEIAKAWLGR
jgi:TPR repeat protein